MKIQNVLVSIAITVSLAGCTSFYSTPSDHPSSISTASSESPFKSVVPVPVTKNTPVPTQIDNVSWDLYPGVKTKVSQLLSEKNCENLELLTNEYLGKDKALDEYFKTQLSSLGCS